MYQRNSETELMAALADTPVVLLNGARQTGKSTLAARLTGAGSATALTLDDATALAAATADPQGFVAGLGERVVIDEVQKAPGLFQAIKLSVDADRRPGRFLLTGSANVLLLPRMSESLAGRMEIVTLEPLSQGELRGRRESFIDALFAGNLPNLAGEPMASLTEIVVAGGYPEALARAAGRRRAAWFEAYITALLQRDVRDLANIEGLTEMPRLLALLAGRVGGLLNMSELARSTGIAQTTLKRYLTLLQATFLFRPLPAWSANLGKRLTKSPKVHLIDCGLTAHLAGHTAESLAANPMHLGGLLETFVVAELRKQAAWSDTRVKLFHYRTAAGREVDLVIEDAAGRIAGIEVKSARGVAAKDFAGIDALDQDAGGRLCAGVVLYTGEQVVAFGRNRFAVPVTALWAARADPRDESA